MSKIIGFLIVLVTVQLLASQSQSEPIARVELPEVTQNQLNYQNKLLSKLLKNSNQRSKESLIDYPKPSHSVNDFENAAFLDGKRITVSCDEVIDYIQNNRNFVQPRPIFVQQDDQSPEQITDFVDRHYRFKENKEFFEPPGPKSWYEDQRERSYSSYIQYQIQSVDGQKSDSLAKDELTRQGQIEALPIRMRLLGDGSGQVWIIPNHGSDSMSLIYFRPDSKNQDSPLTIISTHISDSGLILFPQHYYKNGHSDLALFHISPDYNKIWSNGFDHRLKSLKKYNIPSNEFKPPEHNDNDRNSLQCSNCNQDYKTLSGSFFDYRGYTIGWVAQASTLNRGAIDGIDLKLFYLYLLPDQSFLRTIDDGMPNCYTRITIKD